MFTIKSMLFCILAVMAFMPGCATEVREETATVEMEVTAYCACGKCTGWERRLFSWPPGRAIHTTGSLKGQPKEIGITASGTRVRIGTIAADPRIPFGTRIYIPGYGWGIVEDRGSAITGYRLDVFFPTHERALKWGRQRLVVTIVIEDEEEKRRRIDRRRGRR